MAAPSATTWRGAFTWVPACVAASRREMVSGLPRPISVTGQTATSGTAGGRGIPGQRG